jgi:hypothetical protein
MYVTSNPTQTRLKGTQLTLLQISITPEPQGAIVYSKVWNSTKVQQKLATYPSPWLYDNRKLSW